MHWMRERTLLCLLRLLILLTGVDVGLMVDY